MSKTLTTYEALKANETKRVRVFRIGEWHEVGKMIDLLNRGCLDHKTYTHWEAEEPFIERWGIIHAEDFVTTCASES